MKKSMKNLLLASILYIGITFTVFKTKYVYYEKDYLSLSFFFLGGNYIFIIKITLILLKCFIGPPTFSCVSRISPIHMDQMSPI